MSEENQKAKKIFSKNFSYWLRRRGKTRKDVSTKFKVTETSVSDWCSGKRMPRTYMLLKLKDWLVIDLEDLLCEEIKKNNPINEIIFKLKDNENFYKTVTYLSTLENRGELDIFYKILNSILELDDENKEKVKDYINFINIEKSMLTMKENHINILNKKNDKKIKDIEALINYNKNLIDEFDKLQKE